MSNKTADEWTPTRCPECNKLLFFCGAECCGSVRIKCKRCNTVSELELRDGKIIRHIAREK